MNETIINILNRRSVRGFKPQLIEDDKITDIMKCAIYAPSGVNSQNWQFTVLQSEDSINSLNAEVKKGLSPEAQSKMIARNGGNKNYSVFYNAPCVVVISCDAQDRWAEMNVAFAVENICIAAQSLNISSCIIGYARYAFAIKDFKDEYSLPNGYKPNIAIALGYSDLLPPAPERLKNKVNYIK